jgi:hypothetical protein
MPFNINEIRSGLTLGGARPTLFNIQFVNPASQAADIKVPLLCQAASLPSSNIGRIQVPYFGRTINLAGDRRFEAWNVSILNDEDFLIRNALEQWCNSINSLAGNLRGYGTSASSAYKSNAIVTQYGKTGNVLRQYTLNGIYPEAVSSIDLSWASQDQIETFSVAFLYDWWEVSGGVTGNAGGI